MSFLYDDEKRCVVLTEQNRVKTTYFYDENYRKQETILRMVLAKSFYTTKKNQCISKTDPSFRTYSAAMAYDNRGNLTSRLWILLKEDVLILPMDANNNFD